MSKQGEQVEGKRGCVVHGSSHEIVNEAVDWSWNAVIEYTYDDNNDNVDEGVA